MLVYCRDEREMETVLEAVRGPFYGFREKPGMKARVRKPQANLRVRAGNAG